MKRVHKVDTRSQATAYGKGALLFSVPFIGVGLFFAGMGFELLPLYVRPNAPLWVIGMAGSAFALAGSMIAIQGLRGVANQRRQARLRDSGRSMPSMNDYPWNPGGIEDRPLGRVFHSASMVLFMGVFLAPFNWWAFISDQGGWFIGIITGVFDGILLLVVATTLKRLFQALNFGRSRLNFRQFPFRPGQSLQVALDAPKLRRFDVTLRFIEERFETVEHGNEKRTKLVSYEHFAETKAYESRGDGSEVEISFELPDSEEWVTRLSGKPVRYWELLVEADRPGVDFRTTFPLPVYRG